MIIEDAEVKTQRVWGDKETSQSWIDSNRGRGTGQTSPKTRSEPISTHRDDRQRRNFINQCGQATLGGIVTRLISKTLLEIEESENRTAELKKYLEELKELSQQFRENIEESK